MTLFNILKGIKIHNAIFFSILCASLGLISCSNHGYGFASYDKPPRGSNKYYNRNFKLINTKLQIAKKYIAFDSLGLFQDNFKNNIYFTFYENGFVLKNSTIGFDKDTKPNRILNYSEIHSQDVGSYMIKDDTIFWGTRPGYLKKKMTPYYKAIITDSVLKVLSNSKSVKILSFKLM